MQAFSSNVFASALTNPSFQKVRAMLRRNSCRFAFKLRRVVFSGNPDVLCSSPASARCQGYMALDLRSLQRDLSGGRPKVQHTAMPQAARPMVRMHVKQPGKRRIPFRKKTGQLPAKKGPELTEGSAHPATTSAVSPPAAKKPAEAH